MNSKDERYDKAVTNNCTICGREDLDRTHMHHIIGRTFINERATVKQLRYLAHGLDLEKGLKVDELRKALINNFPQNITEVCAKCHSMTDSYLAWFDNWEAKQTGKSRKSRSRPWIGMRKKDEHATANQQYRRDNPRRQCNRVKDDGERCGSKNRKIPEGGFCHYHTDQDYRGSPMPPLRGWEGEDDWEEHFMDEEHRYALADIHQGLEVDEYHLELFASWPEAWKRRWLYREEW
jgi:hypothetical protein